MFSFIIGEMRKFLIAIILLLGILFIIGKSSELEAISATIQQGSLPFILLAILTQFFLLLGMAFLFKVIYQAIGVEESLPGLLPVVLAANFVNIIAPSGGVSGITILISRARSQRYSSARAMVAGALYVEFDYFGFLCILALGLIVLFRRNNLSGVEIAASFVLASAAVFLAVLLYLGMQSADALGKTLKWLARGINRALYFYLKRDYLSLERASIFAHDAAEGLSELKLNPKKIIRPMLLAIINKLLLVLILYFTFRAFNVPISPGTIVAGFSIAYLFLIVSPTPAGLGFVEGTMTLALSTMYIPLETAAILTLIYRGITFWLPFFIGMLAFRWVGLGEKGNQSTHSDVPQIPGSPS